MRLVGMGFGWGLGAAFFGLFAQSAPVDTLLRPPQRVEMCHDSFFTQWARIPADQWSLLGFHLGMTREAAFDNVDSTSSFYLRPDPFKFRRYYFTDTGTGDRRIPLLYLIWRRGSDSLDEIVIYPVFWKYCAWGLTDSAYHRHIIDLVAEVPGPAETVQGVEVPYIHLWESAVLFPRQKIYLTRLRKDTTLSYRIGLWRTGGRPPTLEGEE